MSLDDVKSFFCYTKHWSNHTPRSIMSLTRHKEGSLGELCTLSLPLMLSSLSVMSMIFVDRLLLAHYSTEALNAAVNATSFGWVFIYGWMVLASIAEVFVAQHNGAGQDRKIGEPVWQMIWLGVSSIFCFIPLAFWGGSLFYGTGPHTAIEREYLYWMMLFGPSFPIYGALCGFFVGRGKTTLITLLAIAANILNAGLDIILIFGIEGLVPSMGPRGAAIATNGSCFFQVIVLGVIFLRKSNRETYGTGQWKIIPSTFLQCLKIGFPGAFYMAIEIFGWSLYYWMMTLAGERYITIAGICQSVIILLYFFSEGVNKAATTIAGNLIGAKNPSAIPKVLFSGFKLHLLFLGVMLILFFFCSSFIPDIFLPEKDPEEIAEIYSSLIVGLFCMIFYLFFEGLRLLIAGILTAAGDTLYLLFSGMFSVWALLVLPIYFFIVQKGAQVEVATCICVFYNLASSLILLHRFSGGRWRELTIVSQENA